MLFPIASSHQRRGRSRRRAAGSCPDALSDRGLGLLDEAGDVLAASKRARRAGTVLVREARFSRDVIEAYGGLCAMCGLDVGLVQAAHIYPVSALHPLSLLEWARPCANHHLAFDKHLIAIDPDTLRIAMAPPASRAGATQRGGKRLVNGTFDHLTEPAYVSAKPKARCSRSDTRCSPAHTTGTSITAELAVGLHVTATPRRHRSSRVMRPRGEPPKQGIKPAWIGCFPSE